MTNNVRILGPQRLRPSLRGALDAADIHGKIALISAGWEEREGEAQELRDHVGREVLDLRVWGRLEDVFNQDRALFDAMQERHDRLRTLRRLYRRQLAHALAAARELWREDVTSQTEAFEMARTDAIAAIRLLDARHVAHVVETHEEFDERLDLGANPHVAHHREELSGVLDGCEALCIAGGHVAILLNRMRSFGILDLWRDRPTFAWSAGAMVLTDQIVLFHDHPPQGAGDAEVLEKGFGLVEDLVLLPHADRRLALDDATRVALFAHRFAPSRCVVLDDGARIEHDGEMWRGVEAARELERDGEVVAFATGSAA